MNDREPRTGIFAFMAEAPRAVTRLRRETSGQIAMMTVIILPILVGFAGLAIDIGFWYKMSRDLQTAADTAAIAAVTELASGGSASDVVDAAEDAAEANGFDSGVEVRNPPTTGSSIGFAGAVEVIITQAPPLFFAKMFVDSK